MDYWTECIEEAFGDAGITATKEQIDNVAGWAEGAHDNYGMAHGYDAIRNPVDTEVKRLKNKMKKMEEQHERRIAGIKRGVITGVAIRRNVNVNSVFIDDDGKVTYET